MLCDIVIKLQVPLILLSVKMSQFIVSEAEYKPRYISSYLNPRYCSSKRGQYKGGTGELGDALKRMLKMGYASWIGHSLNQGKPDLQWKEPMILTFNKKRYNVLLHVDTEIDEAKVIISQDHDAVIDSTDTVVSVALPACTSYDDQVDRLRQYYNIYRIPKIRTNFNFTEGIPPV